MTVDRSSIASAAAAGGGEFTDEYLAGEGCGPMTLILTLDDTGDGRRLITFVNASSIPTVRMCDERLVIHS